MRIILTSILIILVFSIKSQQFTEVSKEMGLDYNTPGIGNIVIGSGVTILDVNNDGWDDLFMSGGVFVSKLWINNKGEFEDKTSEYDLLFLDNYFIQSSIAGDYDNDGFTDLFLCNWGAAKNKGDHLPPVLLKNIDGKRFEKMNFEAFQEPGNYASATWGDFNLDGFIDLYVANYIINMTHSTDSITQQHILEPSCFENKFFINKQGKDFKDESHKYFLHDDGCGLAVNFSDIDQDGDLDIILANDFGEWNHKGNRIFRNNYPFDNFTDISDSIGFYREFYGMGIGPGDYDNDGDLDYYITNIGENCFFENNHGTLVNIADKLGLNLTTSPDSSLSTSWSGIFADFNNDGYLDLYVSNGNVLLETPPTAIEDPNRLFLGNKQKTFTEISQKAKIDDILSHRGAAVVDFDHDGDLDIVSNVIKMGWSEFGGLDQKIKLYRNESKSKNKWIGIKMIGSENTNQYCIGCSIQLINANGEQLKTVDNGTGHGSQSTRIMYFGLGKLKNTGILKLHFTDGTKLELENLSPNHVYEVDQKGNFIKLY